MYNEALFYYYYRRQKIYVGNRPIKVWVEPTNVCNLECKICPQSLGEVSKKGFMDVQLMEKIAADLESIHPKMVTLHLFGEPLLHTRISQLIKILKQKQLNVSFSTNGLLLSKAKIEELIEAGIDDLRIDFSANRKRYEEIRNNKCWDVVYNNIVTLLEMKKKMKLFKPRLFLINMDVMSSHEERIHNFNQLKQLFKKYTLHISNLEIHTWAGEFAAKIVNHPLFKNFLISRNNNYFPCIHLWGSFNIAWNGDVVPCCRDLRKDYVIGNINEMSIKDLWNSERLVQLRKKQILKQYEDIPLCRGCTQLWAEHTLFKLVRKSFRKLFYLKFGR